MRLCVPAEYGAPTKRVECGQKWRPREPDGRREQWPRGHNGMCRGEDGWLGRGRTKRYDLLVRRHSCWRTKPMATTEHKTIKRPCLCGDGAIEVTRSEPDHGYVRPNPAKLVCGRCEECYEIRNGEYDANPWLVTRSEAERQRKAAAKLAASEAEVEGSDEVARLRTRIGHGGLGAGRCARVQSVDERAARAGGRCGQARAYAGENWCGLVASLGWR